MSIRADYQLSQEEFQLASKELTKLVSKTQFRKKSLIGWMLFVGLAIVFFLLMRRGRAAAPPPPPSDSSATPISLILPLLPWLLIFGFVWVFLFRARRKQAAKVFDQNPSLHRRQLATFSEKGIALEDGVSSTTIAWTGFIRFEQTQAFIYLFTGEMVAHFIPKRGFGSPADAESAAALAKSCISPQISAFPVLPAKQG